MCKIIFLKFLKILCVLKKGSCYTQKICASKIFHLLRAKTCEGERKCSCGAMVVTIVDAGLKPRAIDIKPLWGLRFPIHA
jgi:hypothetical protein